MSVPQEELDALEKDLESCKLKTQLLIYEDALDGILALDPGLWKTSKRIAAKARGKEYGDE
jgi:hypothetical protein